MAAPPTTGPRAGRRSEAPPPPRSFLAELPVLVLVAFILALLLKTFLVQAFYIPSESMVPTLEVGDRVLVNKVVYSLRDPERGEVVVFRDDNGFVGLESRSLGQRIRDFLTSGLGAQPSERDFIKRIIGLPGETIEVDDGIVYINGVPLEEDVYDEGGYLLEPDLSDFGPQAVPAGSYFMMGDNRRHSADSRTAMGAIERGELLGRAFVIIWPLDRVDTLPIFSDLGITAALTPWGAAAGGIASAP